ncbi:MAG: acyl carrier protein [Ideonella sp.]|nr:acyl carrier protein [Ideonella sp.]
MSQRAACGRNVAATAAGWGHRIRAFSTSDGSLVSSSVPDVLTGAGVREPQSDAERELAELLVAALNLEQAAADIDPNAPLYGDGLGLDSIDILEVALEVSRRYGFELRSDDENNQRIFTSLRSLAAHVAEHRTR